MKLFPMIGIIVLFVICFGPLTIESRKTSQYHEYHLTLACANNSSATILINNQLPGPTIRANLHDIILVHVHNGLDTDEELSMHFHGIHQRKTPQMDGVAYFTQMPIARGETFTYSFYAYPAGTHFYHSHSGLQFTTAFGALIVDDPDRDFDAIEPSASPLFFSDHWLNINRFVQEQGLVSSPFRWIGEPNQILINGQRNFVLTIGPRRKYILRLIGATSLSTIVFGIREHPMTVLEVDGKLIKPKTNVTSLEIASGQRYVVMIETQPRPTGVFLMSAAIRWRAAPPNSSVVGILRYRPTSIIPADLSSLLSPSLHNETELLRIAHEDGYESLLPDERMPLGDQGRPDREILLVSTQDNTPDGLGIQWMTNNASIHMPSLMNITTSLLLDLSHGFEENLPHELVYTVEHHEIVDIVVQNTVALNGVCESHPMHLHGHSFWVHSHGTGWYDPKKNSWPDTREPVLRDSMMVYATEYSYFTANRNRSNHRKPCGWTKVRFIADNPGLWMLHCHIGAHALMGMTVFIKEDVKHLSMIELS